MFLCIGAASCAVEPALTDFGSVEMDTVNSIVFVKNDTVGVWAPGSEWTLRELSRIGGVDGPEEHMFGGRMHSLGVGPDGDRFLLDFALREARRFSASGEYLGRIGGSGRGPGEFIAPVAMGWDAQDRLWVATAFRAGRYTVFDDRGQLIKTMPRPIPSSTRLQHRLVFLEDGSLIDERSGGAVSLDLVVMDTTGVVVREPPGFAHPELPVEIRSRLVGRNEKFGRALQYSPRLVWDVAEDGTVWFARSDEYRLIQRTLEGDTLRVVSTRHRSSELTRHQSNIIEDGFREIGLEHLAAAFRRPLIRSIHVLRDGHLLVQLWEEENQDESVYDVFDPDGRLLGALDTDIALARQTVPAFVGDTILTVTLGDFDEPYFVTLLLDRSRAADSRQDAP